MHRHAAGVLWVLLYVVLVFTPLVLMAVRPTPPGRPFLIELSVGLGFVGLVMMALQFALIGRFQAMTAPFGIDTLLRYHRQLAGIAIGLIVLHPVTLVLHNSVYLSYLDPIGGTWANRSGAIALYAMIILAVVSIYRQQLRISYELWRYLHAFLALAAITLAHVHIHLAGRYTDAAWKEVVLIAISAVMVGAYGYVRLIRPALSRRKPYSVAEVRPERGAVWSLSLASQGHPGLRFLPGQYAYLKLRNPYTADEHPFSISSSSERPDRVEFAIRELGDFTNKIGQVPIGTTAYLDGPHGSFSTDMTPAAGYVFIAGGIGIAPFMSMLRTLADRRDPRPVLLIYGEKDWESTAFREELEELSKRMPLTVAYTLEKPHEGWEGDVGFVDEAFLRKHLPKEDFERHFFMCGPNPMIDAVERALERVGVPPQNLTAERFKLV